MIGEVVLIIHFFLSHNFRQSVVSEAACKVSIDTVDKHCY